MNKVLMEFPNSEFYNNNLKSDSSVDNITLKDISNVEDDDALLFIDTCDLEKNYEKHLKDSKSIVNHIEARIALKVAIDYMKAGVSENDIGIISPYADQVKLISQKTDIEVKTVDGFQGREKEIIIISTVRSNDYGQIGFLKDLRRLNVAITRAKRKLIIIGNSDTLKSNSTYERLIDFVDEKNLRVKI